MQRNLKILASVVAAGLIAASVSTSASAATPAGEKNISVSLSSSDQLSVSWDSTTGADYYKVRTSSTADMSQDIKTYTVSKSHTSFSIDATGSGYVYAKPSSGNYIFVRVYVVKTSGVVGESPYKQVRLVPPTASAKAQQLKVATYNVRTAESDEPGHSWKSRLSAVAARIKQGAAGVVAIQEAGDHGDQFSVVITQTANGKKKSRDYYWQYEQLRDAVGGNYQLVDNQEYSTGAGKARTLGAKRMPWCGE